jgi:ATP-binding cassette subfamily B protein
MATLYRYLRDYWKLVAAALVLAAINQVFSLLDPLIFRHIIDSYATRFHEYTIGQFIRGVSLLLAARSASPSSRASPRTSRTITST